MNALVIYESIFGNTEEIAEAIAKGLLGRFNVEVAEISHPHIELEKADLLVFGGPTHVLSMSKESTRTDARRKAEARGIDPVSREDGLRELLERLPKDQSEGHPWPLVATFDTSIKKRWIPLGSAAKSAAKQLKKSGFQTVIDAEQFRVAGTEGPLQAGELERAEEWGKQLAAKAADMLPVTSAAPMA